VISGGQIRAARGLLGWSQERLCAAAGVSKRALGRLESGAGDTRRSTIVSVQGALERAGVEFLASGEKGPGVRLAAPEPR
jgi:transcriptional regulator with XRE-family HTH domain